MTGKRLLVFSAIYRISSHFTHLFYQFRPYILLAFVGIRLFAINELTPLSDGLLWFLWTEFKVIGHLISVASVGVTTHKS